MAQRKYVFKFTPAWRKQQSEQWLENMAAQGWHLISGPIFFCFEKGEPEAVRYRFDFRLQPNLREYFDLCKDAGWENVFSFFGWRLFRTGQEDAPELYTDEVSRKGIMRRLLMFLVILAASESVALGILLRGKSPQQLFQNPSSLRGFICGTLSGLGLVVLLSLWNLRKQQKQSRQNFR